jgi:hypothetical protein
VITPKSPIRVKIKLGANGGDNSLIINDEVDLSYALLGFRLEQEGAHREFVLMLSPNASVDIVGEDLAAVLEADR